MSVVPIQASLSSLCCLVTAVGIVADAIGGSSESESLLPSLETEIIADEGISIHISSTPS